jgi:hypothetical protein
MWEFCITIGGRRHCFPLPVLIEKIHLPGPGPVNFPELELATAVLQLIKAVQPSVGPSQFTKQLGDAATQFIQQVQKGLPQGVELTQRQERG